MDLDNIINDIESKDDIAERCICYAEAIIHLQNLKHAYYFPNDPVVWRDDINTKLMKVVHGTIDTNILKLKEMVRLNVTIGKI